MRIAPRILLVLAAVGLVGITPSATEAQTSQSAAESLFAAGFAGLQPVDGGSDFEASSDPSVPDVGERIPILRASVVTANLGRPPEEADLSIREVFGITELNPASAAFGVNQQTLTLVVVETPKPVQLSSNPIQGTSFAYRFTGQNGLQTSPFANEPFLGMGAVLDRAVVEGTEILQFQQVVDDALTPFQNPIGTYEAFTAGPDPRALLFFLLSGVPEAIKLVSSHAAALDPAALYFADVELDPPIDFIDLGDPLEFDDLSERLTSFEEFALITSTGTEAPAENTPPAGDATPPVEANPPAEDTPPVEDVTTPAEQNPPVDPPAEDTPVNPPAESNETGPPPDETTGSPPPANEEESGGGGNLGTTLLIVGGVAAGVTAGGIALTRGARRGGKRGTHPTPAPTPPAAPGTPPPADAAPVPPPDLGDPDDDAEGPLVAHTAQERDEDEVRPHIWIVGERGRSIRELVQTEKFSIVAVAPDTGNAPSTVTVTMRVGTQEEEIELSRTGSDPGTVRYRSDGRVLDDPWVLGDYHVTDGMRMSISASGFYPFTGRAHTTLASAQLALATDYLEQAEQGWRGFLAALPVLREADVEGLDLDAMESRANGFLDQIDMTNQAMDNLLGGDLWDKEARALAMANTGIRHIPIDPIAALRDGLEPVMTYQGADGFKSLLSKSVDFYAGDKLDSTTSVLGTVVLAGYRSYVVASGGDILWTLATGTDEMGEDRDRREAVRDIVIDLLMDRLATRAMTGLTGGTDSLRPANELDAETRLVGDTRTDGPGLNRIVDPETQGIRTELVDRFRQIADDHGVVMALRPGNLAAMEWQRLGLTVKSTEIKTKTVNEVDGVIGGPTTSGVPGGPESPVGLVGYFDPQLPGRPPNITDHQWDRLCNGGRRPDGISDQEWTTMKGEYRDEVVDIFETAFPNGMGDFSSAQVGQRFAQRRHEYGDNAAEYQGLVDDGKVAVRDGLLVETGLYGGTDLPMTGDIDPFEFLRVDGTPVTKEQYAELKAYLISQPDLKVVHGAHMRWPQDKPFEVGSKDEGIFLAIVEKHGWDEPVILIGGFNDGLARTTYTARIDGKPYPGVITGVDGRVLWDPGAGFIARPGGRPGSVPGTGAGLATSRGGRVAMGDAETSGVVDDTSRTDGADTGPPTVSTSSSTSTKPDDGRFDTDFYELPFVDHFDAWHALHAFEAMTESLDGGERPVLDWVFVPRDLWHHTHMTDRSVPWAVDDDGVWVHVHTLDVMRSVKLSGNQSHAPVLEQLRKKRRAQLEGGQEWVDQLDERVGAEQVTPTLLSTDDKAIPI